MTGGMTVINEILSLRQSKEEILQINQRNAV